MSPVPRGPLAAWGLLLPCAFTLLAHADAPTPAGRGQCGPRLMWVETAGCVTLPETVSRVKPQFPRARYDGPVSVHMIVVVDEKGRVRDVRAVRPIAPKPYEDAAVRAVRRWSYRPARDQDGKPVRVEMRVIVSFAVG